MSGEGQAGGAGEVGRRLIPMVYEDVARPAAQEVGATLRGVVALALSPANLVVWSIEQARDYLREEVTRRLRHLPEEEIQAPRPEVALPALVGVRLASEELRELFANLLATAMDRSTAQEAHPAFVEIIKQITPDEARIVRLLGVRQQLPMIDVTSDQPGPLARKFLVLRHFSRIGQQAQCQFPEYTPNYVDNIARLGLAEVQNSSIPELESAYHELEIHGEVQDRIREWHQRHGGSHTAHRRRLELTAFGEQFYGACVIPKVNLE